MTEIHKDKVTAEKWQKALDELKELNQDLAINWDELKDVLVF